MALLRCSYLRGIHLCHLMYWSVLFLSLYPPAYLCVYVSVYLPQCPCVVCLTCKLLLSLQVNLCRG